MGKLKIENCPSAALRMTGAKVGRWGKWGLIMLSGDRTSPNRGHERKTLVAAGSLCDLLM